MKCFELVGKRIGLLGLVRAFEKCFKLFKKGTHYETKRNSGWDSSRSFCMLKGFDKALRVSLPHIWVETSGFGNENHVVESDRASVFDLIGVLV